MAGHPTCAYLQKDEVIITLHIHSASILGEESSLLLSFPVDYTINGSQKALRAHAQIERHPQRWGGHVPQSENE